MSQTLRWMLILGCLMLAVLEAPRSSSLVAEDCAGPYGESLAGVPAPAAPAAHAPAARPDPALEKSARLALAGTR